MLDGLLADTGGSWWDGFYADRARPIPFFAGGLGGGLGYSRERLLA
jgi:hypothetical protein